MATPKIVTEINNLKENKLDTVNHTWNNLQNKPSALPANGGNADTVDGLHASEFYQVGEKIYLPQQNTITDINTLEWPHGSIELQATSSTGTPMLSFHSQGATAVGLFEDGCRLYTTGSDGRKAKRILDIDDYNDLKQSVSNGKQEVVNAINDKIGYVSGLTINHPHVDYAWWIRNQIPTATIDYDKLVVSGKLYYAWNGLQNTVTGNSTITIPEDGYIYISNRVSWSLISGNRTRYSAAENHDSMGSNTYCYKVTAGTVMQNNEGNGQYILVATYSKLRTWFGIKL